MTSVPGVERRPLGLLRRAKLQTKTLEPVSGTGRIFPVWVKIGEMRMSDTSPELANDAGPRRHAVAAFDDRSQRTIFTGGSVLGAIAMSSCCIVPLVLFSLGVQTR